MEGAFHLVRGEITAPEHRFARSCLGALFLVAVYFASAPTEGVTYEPVARVLGHLASSTEAACAARRRLGPDGGLGQLGWRGAAIVSGLTFSLLHLGNPGADWMWLTRLFVQAVLLAYAVYRTGSIWWSTGYRTDWNWASALLFGAVGSGYLDQGHLLDFNPTGLDWLTGGIVGPEGSVFAFIGVRCAFGLLAASTERQGIDDRALRRNATAVTDG